MISKTVSRREMILKSASNEATIPSILKKAGLSVQCMEVGADTEWVVDSFAVTEKPLKDKTVKETKVRLIRRFGNIIKPISPIKIKPIRNRAKPASGRKFKRALIVPDAQIGFLKNEKNKELDPFHDRSAIDLVVQLCRKIRPERVIILGDWLDLADWSDHFFKSPDTFATTQPSIIEACWWLAQFRAASPFAQIDYIAGNHCARMTRAVGENLPVAWNLKPVNGKYPILSIPHLLDLDSIGVNYIDGYPNSEIWINNNLRCSHGRIVRSGSGDSVKQILQEARCSEIVGHLHRVEMATKTIWGHSGPKQYLAASPGTLARLSGPVPKTTNRVNWQQGLGVVDYEEGDGKFHVQLVQIYDSQCVFGGQLYQGAVDKVVRAALSRDTGWGF